MKPHILIIEDEPAWSGQFQDILENMDFDADIVQNIEEAKSALKKNKYTLVLLDAALDQPNFNIRPQGFCDFLRRQYPDLPVIATSGKTLSPPEMWTLSQLGIVDFIYKPVLQLREFQRCIRAALEIPTSSTNPHSESSQQNGPDANTVDAVKLRQVMFEAYDTEELKVLCHDMNVSYGDVEGQNLSTTILGLIGYFQRRNRYGELVKKIRFDRPGWANQL